jgi:hypothetical protein
MVQSGRWGLVGGSMSLGVAQRHTPCPSSPPISLCSSAMLFCHKVSALPQAQPTSMEPANHGLKLLKLWTKISFPPFKWFLSGVCHSDGKSGWQNSIVGTKPSRDDCTLGQWDLEGKAKSFGDTRRGQFRAEIFALWLLQNNISICLVKKRNDKF